MPTVALCTQSSLLARNLGSILRSYGHQVMVADSSIALISACLTQLVEVIIIDSELEFLSAPDAVRCLRVTERTRLIPVIALANDAPQMPEMHKAGADFSLTKPVDTILLLKHLDRLSNRMAIPS